jgi:hypothetical protein
MNDAKRNNQILEGDSNTDSNDQDRLMIGERYFEKR